MSEANTSGAQPVYSIVRLDSTDGKRYQTDAIGSLPVQATNVTQTLGLFDGGADNVGKVEYKSDYVYTADCTIGASGDYPQSQTGGSFPVTVIYTFAQTVGQQTVYGAEIVTTQSYPKEMINDSPRNLYNQRMIKICLTRDDGDCDYRTGYDQDGTVKVPIKATSPILAILISAMASRSTPAIPFILSAPGPAAIRSPLTAAIIFLILPQPESVEVASPGILTG